MTKEEQEKLVSERDHIVIHKITDTVITKHRDGTEVYAVEIVRQPLVRCKDCKYCVSGQCWKADGLDKLDGNVSDDDFCSRGERKESE